MARRRGRRRNRRLPVKVVRFLWHHPLLTFAIALGVGISAWVDHWLSVTAQIQSIVASIVFALVFIIYALASFGYGGIYVVMGLHPLSGVRTVVYVGLTTQKPYYDRQGIQRWPRIEQHLFGSDYYKAQAKPWSDTVTDWHFAHESRHFLPAILSFLEVVNIRWRSPLYNDLWNRHNPDRIDKRTMQAHRTQRDQGIYTREYLAAMQHTRPLLAQH